jgi:hypothetical protein
VLTMVDPCIWHGCGTNLSRRQSATMAGASTDWARVCLAAPTPASATLLACAVDQNNPRRPSPSRRSASYQLGKLRSLARVLGADLGEQSSRGLVGRGCFPRDSPLLPAPSGAVVVRSAGRMLGAAWLRGGLVIARTNPSP